MEHCISKYVEDNQINRSINLQTWNYSQMFGGRDFVETNLPPNNVCIKF